MTKTYDRDKAAKILEGYPASEWDAETRDALLGELETCYTEDPRLAAIRNHVEEKIKTTGLYAGTVEWTLYGILQDGLPIPGLEPVEVSPVAGRTTAEQVTVSVQGVAATLSKDEANELVKSLQYAIRESVVRAAERRTELKKMAKQEKNADEQGSDDAGDNGTDSA